jgi:hypothetical protein
VRVFVINCIVNNQETFIIIATIHSSEEVINRIFLNQLPGVQVLKIAYCDGINIKQFTAIEPGKSDEIQGSYRAALRKYLNTHCLFSVFFMFKMFIIFL